MDDPDIHRSPRSQEKDDQTRDEYLPGVCNIDRKGRLIRGGGAFVGLVLVVIYNELWRTIFTHPVLYTAGLLILSTGTALSLIQAMVSFCVVDGFLGRTFIAGSKGKPVALSPENRAMDRKRALVIMGGALLAGIFFSAVLLISEINQSHG